MDGNTSLNEDYEEDIAAIPSSRDVESLESNDSFDLPMDCVGYIVSFSSSRDFFNLILSCKSIYQYLTVTKTNCCLDRFTMFQKPKNRVSFVTNLMIHRKIGSEVQDKWVTKYFVPHQLRKLDTSEVCELNYTFDHDKVLEMFGTNLIEYKSVYSSELIGKMKNLETIIVSNVLEFPRVTRNDSQFQSKDWKSLSGLSKLTRVDIYVQSHRRLGNEERGYNIDLTLLPTKQINDLKLELNFSLSFVNIEKLSEFTNLKKLHCREICYYDFDFDSNQSRYNRITMKPEYLSGCSRVLESLLCDSIEGGVMKILHGNLKNLSLFEWKEELIIESEHYRYFDRIESLDVDWGYLPSTIYRYLKNVKTISFPTPPHTAISQPITNEDVLSIGPQLEGIGRLFSESVTDELFQKLEEQNNDLKFLCGVGCRNLTDRMFEYVPNLEKLGVTLFSVEITGSGLRHLNKLKDVDFWGFCKLYDISQALRSSKKSLVRLVLNGTVTCSDDLLHGAENLEVLEVRNAEGITNVGLGELKNYNKLRVLRLYYNGDGDGEMKISDDVFGDGFEKLEHLEIVPKKIAGRCVKKLVKNTTLILHE